MHTKCIKTCGNWRWLSEIKLIEMKLHFWLNQLKNQGRKIFLKNRQKKKKSEALYQCQSIYTFFWLSIDSRKTHLTVILEDEGRNLFERFRHGLETSWLLSRIYKVLFHFYKCILAHIRGMINKYRDWRFIFFFFLNFEFELRCVFSVETYRTGWCRDELV